jgi:hypothetical protein
MRKILLLKYMMLSLNAPTSLFSLSQTSSDIRFGDRNPAFSHTAITDCWLRNEYSAQLIISQLEQVVTSSIRRENHDLTAQPVIAYIYVCGHDGTHPVYITFKNVVLLQTRKWTEMQDRFRTYILNLHLIIYR